MKGSPVSCEEGTLFLSGCPADTVLQVFGPGFGQGSTDLISGGMHHAVSSIGPDGLSVGEIGMGCEGFLDRPYEQVCEYVDIMEQAGANLIDLYAPNPTFRSDLGRALEGRRDRFILQGAFVHGSGNMASIREPAISGK